MKNFSGSSSTWYCWQWDGTSDDAAKYSAEKDSLLRRVSQMKVWVVTFSELDDLDPVLPESEEGCIVVRNV
jgi:hypothetical protein